MITFRSPPSWKPKHTFMVLAYLAVVLVLTLASLFPFAHYPIWTAMGLFLLLSVLGAAILLTFGFFLSRLLPLAKNSEPADAPNDGPATPGVDADASGRGRHR